MSVAIVVDLLAGLAFLAGAVISMRKGAIQFKSGYRVQRTADPVGFFVLLIMLSCGGLFFFIMAALKLYDYTSH